MTEKDQFDVVIVGAGPAGSSAAIRLASGGSRVALVEQKIFPRHKLCGEFVSPECLDLLEEIGVLPNLIAAQPAEILRTRFYARNGSNIAVESSWFGDHGKSAIGISRSELDLQMLKEAEGAGVTVFSGTSFTGVVARGTGNLAVKLRPQSGSSYQVFGRLLIDATGRNRIVAKKAENKTSDSSAAKHVAFKAHFVGANVDNGTCEIYVYPDGYGGCSRIENGKYNLCFIASADDTKRLGSDPERVMHEVLFKNQRARDVLENASITSEWLAVPVQRFGRGSLSPAKGVLTIGDAASFIDPFTGSGILMALQSAKIAANAISEHFARNSLFDELAGDYANAYGKTFDRRLRISSLVRRAAFSPVLGESLIRGLSLSGSFRRRIARATREPSRSTT